MTLPGFPRPSNLRGEGNFRGPTERHVRALQNAMQKLQNEMDDLPRGLVAYVENVSGTTQSVTGGADVDGCSLTYTAEPNRKYRIVGEARFRTQSNGIPTEAILSITLPDNTQLQVSGGYVSSSGANTYPTLIRVELIYDTGAGGLTTRKLRTNSDANSTIHHSGQRPSFIYVEDIGAA